MARFPRDFVWGTATSAYQIEGAVAEDGRGPSIWDHFCTLPGRVRGGDSGEVACDHYHRYPGDLDLLVDLGVDAYRLSLSWPRVFPTGQETRPEQRGLDFYDRLIDGLLSRGITPWVTLYHWDMPQALEDLGGWPSRDTVDAFLRFADASSRRLGDRVRHWITINEPWVVAHLGYNAGVHAPGRKDPAASLATAHHLLLAHGRAVPLLRSNVTDAQVGIVLNMSHPEPASDSEADADEARRSDGSVARWYLDPLYGRGYPADVLADYRADGVLPTADPPWLHPTDLDEIAVETDFIGINYYMRAVARSTRIPEADNQPRTIPEPGPDKLTDFGWEIHAESLTALLLRLRRDYAPEQIYVTENGAAYRVGPGPDGRIHDDRRITYLRQHIDACARAIEQGAPLAGYFAWSLLDNFEWAEGYDQRFGLVWVDFDTQRRIKKDSFGWYRDRIAQERAQQAAAARGGG